MSLASKITLAASCMASAVIIGYVHYRQHDDREKLHQGVLKDIERQQMRKIENIYLIQQQEDYAKQLRAMESENKSKIEAQL